MTPGGDVSAFEFFFSFYGLLLGLSVAELVGGFARVLHEKQRIRFGWLTPMLALFVAIDIATFWNQAWVIFRGAPFNTFVLLISLAIAATFYVAASVTFPRVSTKGVGERLDLDDHFWSHRRLVFGCILAANLIVAVVVLGLAQLNSDFAPARFVRPALGGGGHIRDRHSDGRLCTPAPGRGGRLDRRSALQPVGRGELGGDPDQGWRLGAGAGRRLNLVSWMQSAHEEP